MKVEDIHISFDCLLDEVKSVPDPSTFSPFLCPFHPCDMRRRPTVGQTGTTMDPFPYSLGGPGPWDCRDPTNSRLRVTVRLHFYPLLPTRPRTS